ncbi:MAG TPA: MBOAT family O-acyltransferase, partial [Bacteroidales bacterium]|nr:MBOAT family O-acyltransferase [Bacteroidales bacterium]
MVFSSIIFLLYFLPLFFIVYYFLPIRLRNLWIVLGSIFFYSWGAPKFIMVILGTTLLDFFLVKWMDKTQEGNRKKAVLTIIVLINIGLLVYFKYSNFFIENLNEMLALIGVSGVHWTKLVLPIGISFYTFETITYVVDVYRKVHKPLDNYLDYQLYIILFPKLIAGPIVRYHDLADQITDRSRNENLEYRLTGFYRFIIGLSKKIFIANVLGKHADLVLSTDLVSLDTASAWSGLLAYAFQIYFDFSGYSDMAIGLCRMMGFVIPENFNSPYVSSSITEYWRRWHISLGSWMKNYLYIPLGGNRVSNYRHYLNLWLVFLASGFWHGASWNFIIWGAWHGLFLVIERAFLLSWYQRAGRFVGTFFTFFFIFVGWVLFRTETLSEAIILYERLFVFTQGF